MIAALWTLWSQASAAGITVENAATHMVNDFYVVDADIKYQLSDEAIEAITNGVPVTITIEIEIRQPRNYLWDVKIAKIRQRYRVEHHALTGQYLIVNLVNGTRRHFPSIDAAALALGTLEQVPVVKQGRLSPHSTYKASLRARLDLEALPAPLRLIAFFSPSWYLSSGWYRWEFDS